jgi:glycosyltransferase involved in cell wall biosynthesis
MGKKILICEFNLFSQVGGGQTVYQNLIRRRPNDRFYYFTKESPGESARPTNAVEVPFKEFYGARPQDIPGTYDHFIYVYRDAMDMARSFREAVPETSLDVVDTPDYRQNGLFLRDAFETHGVSVGIVALALHGALSSALTLAWPWTDNPGRSFAQLRLREQMQFRAVEARYAVSQFYADALQRRARYPINLLDPLAVIRDTHPAPSSGQDGPPDLLFIGRRERRKGPDLFVDFAWWLPKNAYRRLLFIGGEGVNHQGGDSRAIVDAMASRRRLSPEFVSPLTQSELRELIRRKSVVVVPSRYDQFNLVALEALMDGCPTVISRHTGVAEFIEKRLPDLSWLLVDIECDRAATIPIRAILQDYDAKRSCILESLQRAQLEPDSDSPHHIYDPADKLDHPVRGLLHDMADRFAMFSFPNTASRAFAAGAAPVQPRPIERIPAQEARQLTHLIVPPGEAVAGRFIEAASDAQHRSEAVQLVPTMGATVPTQSAKQVMARLDTKQLVRHIAQRVVTAGKTSAGLAVRAAHHLRPPRVSAKSIIKSMIDRGDITVFGLNGTAARQAMLLEQGPSIRSNLVQLSERGRAAQKEKLKYLTNIVSWRRVDRARSFREMMRLERLLGNDLIAATYGLRIIRWLGHDHFRLLPSIEESLNAHGFAREAETARAMYGDPERADDICRAFLADQLQRHRLNAEKPWQTIDDRRSKQPSRVSVIVSLYNAAKKLPTFWTMLTQQTLIQSGQAEVVFVDSGSPSDEYTVFQELSSRNPLPAIYARSKQRETIQTAWNRGINLSAGANLAFLGVDEGVHPDCLRILSDELDQNPSVDWVMADSIVTEVDRASIFNRDVMLYDRTGYRHDWHYLDCTFLSYVGGLYRRSIHDRFGYYDESFRAAGDTEFKNRILPHIKTKYIPGSLGVFNNYPEERTTQHPRAEIEDLRAWYLHRTPAGVSYAFDRRPTADVVALLKDTLGYRKCYCQHTSMDLDLANSLAAHLAKREDGGRWHEVRAETRQILETLQSFELLPYTGSIKRDQLGFVRNYRKMLRLSRNLGRALDLDTAPAFDVFHDNRYEQHWWSWST